MRRFVIVYLIFVFLGLALFSSGTIESQDGLQYLTIARQIYFNHTLTMPTAKYPRDNIHMNVQLGNSGQEYSPTGLGYSLALMPAVILEDLSLKLAQIEPVQAFPLKGDWPVLFFASFINPMFGAILAVIFYLYLRSYNITHSSALLVSLVGIVATNIWPYTKHGFAHMMFITFMTLTFYCFRRAHLVKKSLVMFWAGVSFGLVIIAYNPTFIFLVIPLAIYYLLLNWRRWSAFIPDSLMFAIGAGPFALLYLIFNKVRFGDVISAGYRAAPGLPLPIPAPNYIKFEGIWSVLLSPGKSIFLYTPLLLLIIVFWFKLKKKLLPEIVSWLILVATYTYFIGTFIGGGDYPVWHGEASWGPRYMLPIIPLAVILVGHIYTRLSRRQKIFIFTPLVMIGIWIQLLGVIIPYQIRFAGLELKADINNRLTDLNEYGNLIPRYSPVFSFTKLLPRRMLQLPQLYNHGLYDLRLINGFSGIFDNGGVVMREISTQSNISFDQRQPIDSLTLQFINYQINPTSSISAQATLSLNQGPTIEKSVPAGQDTFISVPLNNQLQPNNNQLHINLQLGDQTTTSIKDKQIIFLRNVFINQTPQPLKTLDYPFVSPFSKKKLNLDYKSTGVDQLTAWQTWQTRSAIYENTLDLWWIKALHYWDLPHSFFGLLFALNILGIIYSGFLIFSFQPKTR